MKIDKYLPGKVHFWIEKNILNKRMSRIYSGPLKGYYWNMSTDYRYITGTYEEKFVQIISILAKDKIPVFYDLGANFGYLSIVYAKVFPDSIVYAFEPFKECLSIFREHLNINNINTGRLHIIESAISNANRTLEFSISSNLAANTYIKESSVFTENRDKLLINATSLDHFVYDQNNPIPDIIKINIEGAEFDALQGAERILAESKPFLLLSTHDLHKPGVKNECLDFLFERNYQCIHVPKRMSLGLDDYVCYHRSKADRYSKIINFLSQ